MAKKKKRRPAEPRVLGDLIPGDRAVIATDWGDLPLRVSWHQGAVTFCRLDLPNAPGMVQHYPSNSKIVKLGELMPQSGGKAKKTNHSDEDDPLLKGN